MKTKIKVYVVVDDSKSCYDAGDMYRSVHGSLEEAEKTLSVFDKRDRANFDIYEEEIEVEL